MWQRLVVLLFLLSSVTLSQAATPTSDFSDNGDGTATHKITGLTWKRCAEGMAWTGSTCTGTAKTYTWAEANALSASGGWRLPRTDELVGIVKRDNVKPAINSTIFPNTPSSGFWSASISAGGLDDAWGVNFYGGYDGTGGKAHTYYVRLVRGGQSLGSSGLYTPSGDFTDNGDGTVTHRKTGLTWKRCAEGMAWTGTTCAGAANGYTWDQANALSASGGWRLPSQNELQTLVEYSIASPGPTINSTIFPNTPASSYFWSASAHVGGSGYAWYVNFGNGSDHAINKSFSSYVRLVRSLLK